MKMVRSKKGLHTRTRALLRRCLSNVQRFAETVSARDQGLQDEIREMKQKAQDKQNEIDNDEDGGEEESGEPVETYEEKVSY